MRNQLFAALLLMFFFVFSSIAQTSASGTAQVGNGDTKTDNYANAENLTVDFKNFSFPDFASKEKKNFTLKNGIFEYENAKKSAFYSYRFRKVYYFDVTGDEKTEAIAHIFATMCDSCLPNSIFYLYSNEKNQPKEVWKIALGTQEKCGLKEVRFNRLEVILEAFGECALKDWTIAKELKSKKSDIFTRFVFNRKDGNFTQTSKELLPFPAKDIPAHRSQMKFGGAN